MKNNIKSCHCLEQYTGMLFVILKHKKGQRSIVKLLSFPILSISYRVRYNLMGHHYHVPTHHPTFNCEEHYLPTYLLELNLSLPQSLYSYILKTNKCSIGEYCENTWCEIQPSVCKNSGKCWETANGYSCNCTGKSWLKI